MGNDSEKWLGAMRSEMDSMYENQVWDLVDLPEGSRTVDCKWLYKVKNDMLFPSVSLILVRIEGELINGLLKDVVLRLHSEQYA